MLMRPRDSLLRSLRRSTSDGSRYEKRVDAKGRESEPVCIDGEIPFEIPRGWEWARLGTFASFGGGGTPDKNNPSFWNGDIPWASMKDIHGSRLEGTIDSITEAGLKSKASISICQPGQIIVSTRLIPGKTILSGIRCAINQDLKVVHTILPVGYLIVWFNSHLAEFKRIGSGTTVPGIKLADLENALVPVPPLAEQRRIAERVSGLMPLVEEYGKFEAEREALDAALPDRLRKSVLQMAVEGKLAPQDSSDEPASALLERIREERAKLIKEKKIKTPKGGESVIYLGSDGRRYEKRGKGEPVCIDDEIPFDIPKGWEWARFESVLYNRDAERIPVSVAEREKLEKRYDYYGASGVIDKVDKYLFDKPLLLIGEDGANLLARTKPIAFMARGQYWVNNHAHVLDGLSEVLLEYISLFINSISLAPYVTGTAQPKMNQAKMNSILIPLPPEEEQARILKRVAELKVLVTNR